MGGHALSGDDHGLVVRYRARRRERVRVLEPEAVVAVSTGREQSSVSADREDGLVVHGDRFLGRLLGLDVPLDLARPGSIRSTSVPRDT